MQRMHESAFAEEFFRASVSSDHTRRACTDAHIGFVIRLFGCNLPHKTKRDISQADGGR
jgi:hypothetical protein